MSLVAIETGRQNTVRRFNETQFPYPNQLDSRKPGALAQPDLRPVPKGVGKNTLEGTRAAARTIICYRNGGLNRKGASLLDGYMEDLATDRIYRLMSEVQFRVRSLPFTSRCLCLLFAV